MSKTKLMSFLVFLTLMALVLVACQPAATETAAPEPDVVETEVAEPEEPPEEEPKEPASSDEGKFTIGISNPFISSEYRTQMIASLIEVNQEYMDRGITTELVIESADTDVAGQIQQLQNLIAKEVDAILVNPGDVSGLNATLQEALDKGIIVISVDQELDVPNVYNVGIDQKKWAMTSADWLAETLGGEGDIVEIEGFPGHPANVARMDGVDEVFAENPGINVLARDTGLWDEATGQQVMSNFLAAFPNLEGYWTQDGMAIGALQAVMAANPAEWPAAVGEGRCQFINLWVDVLEDQPDFETIAVANPPGVSPTGLRVAVNMLLGEKVNESTLGGANGLSFVIPVPMTVTNENLQQAIDYCADKPDAHLLDGIMTDQEVLDTYFGEDTEVMQDPFTIGISNPFISSEYRTQMIASLIEVNQEYMDQGLTTELVIESADTDVAGQIQQLQNLIAKEVDAILVNPGDVSGLNATLEEALDKGIIVISVDQELNVPNVYNVGIDQKEWAMTSASWLAETLGGEGDIVEIEGFPGHPANVARMDGVDEVFSENPGINVLARDTGLWDEATGQQVMSNFLAAFPNLNGYWTQDGMAIGALQAVMAANPAEWPAAVGEGRCQFINLWVDVLESQPEFETIAVANPPGVSPTGLRVAVNMLSGKEVEDSTLGGVNGLSFVIPVPMTVTNENLQEAIDYCADKPDAHLLDGIMTNQEVLDTFFK
ncbi:substrate-binding domain-containing protein [Chloroflexota bacterium]